MRLVRWPETSERSSADWLERHLAERIQDRFAIPLVEIVVGCDGEFLMDGTRSITMSAA